MFILPLPPNAPVADVKPAPKRTASGTEYVASTHWAFYTQTTATVAPGKVSK